MKVKPSGFTLIELMVVIVIFAILMGMVVYSMWNINPTLKLKQAGDTALGALRLGRGRAIRSDAWVIVTFQKNAPPTTPSSYTIRWQDNTNHVWVVEGTGNFPNNATYVPNATGDTVYRFVGDGSCNLSPATNPLIVTQGRRADTLKISVMPATGLARILP